MTTSALSSRPPRGVRRPQQGVVLVIALIMMAVIAISSAAAIKSAMTQDRIGANQRSASIAMQAAEAALRYCEALVYTPTWTAEQAGLVTNIREVFPETATQTRWWQDISNWNGATPRAFDLPTSFVVAPGLTFNKRPQCLIEKISLPDITSSSFPASVQSTESYEITVRGFSPDYEASNNVPTRGAVIWLQSTVQIRRP
ncbi:MAG: hypothetical protein EOP38_03710 [Rubrivivax sp.]|nr:MAG: hypothetical protein EOP38_03710 [Rubrivivax sp.]